MVRLFTETDLGGVKATSRFQQQSFVPNPTHVRLKSLVPSREKQLPDYT